jgi:hypothetical protein
MIFDYARSKGEHRYVQLGMLPGSATPAFTDARAARAVGCARGTSASGGAPAHSNCFVIVEPGATIEIASGFGALFSRLVRCAHRLG